MFVVLLVMMLGFAQLSPYFLTKDNLLQVTVQAAVICMLGAGQTFVILTAGIDLGVGSVLALVTVVSAIVMESWAGLARSNVLIAGQQGGGLIPASSRDCWWAPPAVSRTAWSSEGFACRHLWRRSA